MDKSNTACSHGKQRLLAEDYTESAIGYTTNSRRSRRGDVCYVTLAAISVVACIFACIFAACCYSALVEIQRLQDGKVTPDTSTVPTTSSAQAQYEYMFEGEDFDNDYEEYYESDESDAGDEDYDYDDAAAAADDDDEDIPAEGSGESSESGSNGFNKKSLMRTRRDTKGQLEKCKDKCRRRANSDKKINRCTRRCEKGGKTGGKKNSGKGRKNVPYMIPVSLPAAHFETAMNDKAIENAVGIDLNPYVTTETCKYIEEMEGKLCLNRTFYPYKNDVPLNIFKPADWVDETSPVMFHNSVATSKAAGIFLIYAQAYIGGKEPEKSIRIVQKRKSQKINSIACNNGMHVDHFDSRSNQLQTCSVLGLMKLEEGDTIEIQKSAASLEIILDTDKTYFGLVQLNSVAVQVMKTNKKNKN